MSEQLSILRNKIIQMTKSPMMIQFTGERIVQRLTQKDLVKIEKIMKKHPSLTITIFLRILRNIMSPTSQQDFYLTYGLFRLFQEICISTRKRQVSFDDISTMITQKMPSFNQQILLRQKLYPHSLNIPDTIKKKIFAPQIIGKVLEQRQRLQQNWYISDKILHINRRVKQSIYSNSNKIFYSIDYPSTQIKILSSQFVEIRNLKTQLQISKRDSIIMYLAWSQHQQRLAALLGNYSISIWSKEDNYRYQVNVPLPIAFLATPYVMIGYMISCKMWYALDNHPSIHILSSYNYQPQYTFTHFKMIKQKSTQKIHTTEIYYRKLLCVGFQRNLFLISLERRQIVTQLQQFKTSITSLAFSQTYQALFVSNFQYSFSSFELSQHQDLTEKGKFEGHKSLISLIGVLQQRPVVYSIDQDSVIKLWDIRDFSCYQTFNVLKNIIFHQVLALHQSICLIGSKHFCYRWQKFTQYQQKDLVILIGQVQKNILLVMSKQIKIYSHSNGVLLKVIKGIFTNSFIACALSIQILKVLLVADDDGRVKVYSTKDFNILSQFQILAKPCYLSYQIQTQLLTTCSMGQLRISQFKQGIQLDIKRTIYNDQQLIKYCKISTLHDIIAIQYHSTNHLFFYSYQRAKPLGFLLIDDLINIEFLHQKNIILILSKDKLMIMTFKKFQNSITFFYKDMIKIWSQQDLKLQNISYNQVSKHVNELISTNLLYYQDYIVISSTNTNLVCHVNINIQKSGYQKVKINKQNYNPYRVTTQDHNKSFEISKPSLIIDDKNQKIFTHTTYIRHHRQTSAFQLLSKLNYYYCISNQKNIIFYNSQSKIKGILDYKQTLPLTWDLHNYSQEQFNQLQFVYSFIQQQPSQRHTQHKLNLSSLFNIKPQVAELLILNSFQDSLSPSKKYKPISLRQKKMVLQKQRDQKQKYQNYLQVRKGQQSIKAKQVNRTGNQKYINQALTFLNVNRNKLLLSNTNTDAQLPQIKSLQIKLNASVNRDQKKSMISKHSYPHSNINTIVNKVKIDTTPILKSNLLYNSQMHLLKQSTNLGSYKEQIKKLNDALKESKFSHKNRSSSLPFLKRNSQYATS